MNFILYNINRFL